MAGGWLQYGLNNIVLIAFAQAVTDASGRHSRECFSGFLWMLWMMFSQMFFLPGAFG